MRRRIGAAGWLVLIAVLVPAGPAMVVPAAEIPSVSSVADATRGLIGRILPAQADKMVVEIITRDNGRDIFEAESRDGKIGLRGDNAMAIASALNWCLKNEGQESVWINTFTNFEYIASQPHYLIFPRGCALAEGVWSPPAACDWNGFQSWLAVDERRLDELGVNYRHEQ